MKAYNKNNNELVYDYIGTWYKGQFFPQDVYLYINGDTEEIYIEERHLGGGCSADEFHGIVLGIRLLHHIYTNEEADKIIEFTKEKCKKLFESFEIKYNGNNYVGSWNYELVLDLQYELENEFMNMESALFFDSEGIMESENTEQSHAQDE